MTMKNQKWVIVPIVLVLIVGTAGALTWLRAHQKLGQPGIKAAPVPGTARMRIDLPELVLDYTSTNMPESEVELSYFPPDTSYVRRIYRDPDGFSVSGTYFDREGTRGNGGTAARNRVGIIGGIRSQRCNLDVVSGDGCATVSCSR